MDYSTDCDKRPLGVVYNSSKPIGGIRYYQDEIAQKSLILASLKKKVLGSEQPVVSLETKTNPAREFAPEKIDPNFVSAEPEKQLESNPEIAKSSAEENSNSSAYIVSIQGTEVDFSAEGIEACELSEDEEEWLRKAQNYFLNVTENNKRIGSSENYTSLEILKALWATAVETEIDPKRFIIQMFNESRFNPNLTGYAGERGLGQFKESTAEMLGYDWEKMCAGDESFAYQAKASAEFIARVGEERYNGAGLAAKKYRHLISTRLRKIKRTKPLLG